MPLEIGTDCEFDSACPRELIVKFIQHTLRDRTDCKIDSACPRELIVKLIVHALGHRD